MSDKESPEDDSLLDRKEDLKFPGEEEEDDQVMSIADLNQMFEEKIEEENEAINTSRAVIGSFDEKQCSYDLIKAPGRQAIFSCATCETKTNPETGTKYQAGFCFACSVNCHKDHEIYELWTKRNFNCDCGTDRYVKPDCQLFDKKGFFNGDNAYNHNFDGHYCVCDKEPFPEEYENDQEMSKQLQCVICEDWFHLPHIKPVRTVKTARVGGDKTKNEDLFCVMCIEKHPFLAYYFYPSSVEKVFGPGKVKTGEKRKLDEVDGANSNSSTISTSVDGNSVSVSAESGNSATVSASAAENGCKLLAAKEKSEILDENSPEFKKILTTFKVFSGWRKSLCRCDECMKMYEERGVQYLIDQEDSINEYVDKTKEQRKTDLYEEAYSNLSHVQKIGIITLKQKLNRFLADFHEKKPGAVLTVDDVNKFVEKELKRPRLY